jgi:protoporphyrinogen oxidase
VTRPHRVAVIGAGPAGLTAAYLLSKASVPVTVLEADPRYVGGISRTVEHKGFCFDIGGHRFFSKSKQIEELWTELLPNGMIERPRSSRIYYRGTYFSYPLRPLEALSKLGPVEAALCVASYLKARALPIQQPDNFEDWVVNHFGSRLYSIFFKHYTEKVWGMSCREISADWAAQRIKGLSLTSAVMGALKKPSSGAKGDGVIKTLIDTYRYPRKGPGMVWDACTAKVRELGNVVRLGRRVTGLTFDPVGPVWKITHEGNDGPREELVAEHVISSAPIRELVASIAPRASESARAAAEALRYRDFLIVTLILKGDPPFSDNWVYIQDPEVKCGRVQNFKSWSPDMVPDPAYSSLGCEYFCHEGDGLWNSSDEELVALATREMTRIGLLTPGTLVDSCVVRQHKAYPVYDADYNRHVEVIRQEIEDRFPNLHLVGRNGMHKYNNQDHSMMTAMLCAENILAGRPIYNLWRVNQDAEYHESGEAGAQGKTGRLVPERLRRFSSRPPKAS